MKTLLLLLAYTIYSLSYKDAVITPTHKNLSDSTEWVFSIYDANGNIYTTLKKFPYKLTHSDSIKLKKEALLEYHKLKS